MIYPALEAVIRVKLCESNPAMNDSAFHGNRRAFRTPALLPACPEDGNNAPITVFDSDCLAPKKPFRRPFSIWTNMNSNQNLHTQLTRNL
jgi:hypothetical protein